MQSFGFIRPATILCGLPESGCHGYLGETAEVQHLFLGWVATNLVLWSSVVHLEAVKKDLPVADDG